MIGRRFVQVVVFDEVIPPWEQVLNVVLPRWGRALVRDDGRELVVRTWWGRVVRQMPILRVGDAHQGVMDRDPDWGYFHTVTWWEEAVAAVRGRAPRSLCGLLLEDDPERPDLGSALPRCPRCAAL